MHVAGINLAIIYMYSRIAMLRCVLPAAAGLAYSPLAIFFVIE
jgi:hypothetical protein